MKAPPCLMGDAGIAAASSRSRPGAENPGSVPCAVVKKVPLVFSQAGGAGRGDGGRGSAGRQDRPGRASDRRAGDGLYPEGALPSEAVDAVRQYEFKAGEVGGRRVWEQVPMAFEFNWSMLGTSRIGPQEGGLLRTREVRLHGRAAGPALDRAPTRTKTVVPAALNDADPGRGPRAGSWSNSTSIKRARCGCPRSSRRTTRSWTGCCCRWSSTGSTSRRSSTASRCWRGPARSSSSRVKVANPGSATASPMKSCLRFWAAIGLAAGLGSGTARAAAPRRTSCPAR